MKSSYHYSEDVNERATALLAEERIREIKGAKKEDKGK